MCVHIMYSAMVNGPVQGATLDPLPFGRVWSTLYPISLRRVRRVRGCFRRVRPDTTQRPARTPPPPATGGDGSSRAGTVGGGGYQRRRRRRSLITIISLPSTRPTTTTNYSRDIKSADENIYCDFMGAREPHRTTGCCRRVNW